MNKVLVYFKVSIFSSKWKEQTELIFTNGLAGFSCWINLITLLTLAFVAAYLIDTDLAASVRVGTLINI